MAMIIIEGGSFDHKIVKAYTTQEKSKRKKDQSRVKGITFMT